MNIAYKIVDRNLEWKTQSAVEDTYFDCLEWIR